MSLGRARELTKHLRRYDTQLYAESHEGRIDVCRKNQARPAEPHYIFSLTQNWTARSKPVDWGIDVVLNRVKAQDLWRDEKFVDRLIAEMEEAEASGKRQLKNSVESFLLDFRKQFARATNGINTSTIDKTDRRRMGDLKHGYR